MATSEFLVAAPEKEFLYQLDLMRDLDWEDERRAYSAMRVVFQGLRDRLTVEEVVRAVFNLLATRIARGEIDDIKHVLPKELVRLWP